METDPGEPLHLHYDGNGLSGAIDLGPWVAGASPDDVTALMGMAAGVEYAGTTDGLKEAYQTLAGAHGGSTPRTVLFHDQAALLERLRREAPMLWEAASGCALRCAHTIDLFGSPS